MQLDVVLVRLQARTEASSNAKTSIMRLVAPSRCATLTLLHGKAAVDRDRSVATTLGDGVGVRVLGERGQAPAARRRARAIASAYGGSIQRRDQSEDPRSTLLLCYTHAFAWRGQLTRCSLSRLKESRWRLFSSRPST